MDLWTEIHLSPVSGMTKYRVYLNNLWILILNFWPRMAHGVVSPCCLIFSCLLFAELGCEYRDLAFISLHTLKYLGYYFSA